MSDFRDIAINLAATVIAFVFGLIVRGVLHGWRVRRARSFWGTTFSSGSTLMVLGQLPPEYLKIEPSGLVGLGDTYAIQEMTVLLTDLDITFELTYSDKVAGRHDSNLILIGGDDVNGLVDHLKDRYESKYRYDHEHGPLRILDSDRQETLEPVWHKNRSEGVRFDYGVVSRMRSPYAENRVVISIGGIYGFGTWGGVRLLRSPDFKRSLKERGDSDFECLYRVEVWKGEILAVDVLSLSGLQRHEPPDALPSERTGRNAVASDQVPRAGTA